MKKKYKGDSQRPTQKERKEWVKAKERETERQRQR